MAIERVSEKPFWGPEEQIRKFVNQHDDPEKFDSTQSQLIVTQQRISNLDDIFQKQLIWSYTHKDVSEAYYYWDWCPVGEGTSEDPRWQISEWNEHEENLQRSKDRLFDFRKFKGYSDSGTRDQMVREYSAHDDAHAREDDGSASDSSSGVDVDLDVETLRHNIMRSYIEVSEWLGDGALQYGSHNGYVSRKMSMAWLFDAIRALINWKLNHQSGDGDADIHPLAGDEKFLPSGHESPCGIDYKDDEDLDQKAGRCGLQKNVRSSSPNSKGILIVRGNEWHYGERADFYTHNSFMGECRFFHNARFLGQATFDKEINGIAMRSRWADISEYYEADEKYESGTLVMFGGKKEITVSDGRVVNGIITTNPGFIMNGDAPSKDAIAIGLVLAGRVPVKIYEKVYKFDRIVPSRKFPGYARRRKWYEFWKKPIGIALEDSTDGMVECVTMLRF